MRVRPFPIAIVMAWTFFPSLVGSVRAQEEDVGGTRSRPLISSDGATRTLSGTSVLPAFTGPEFEWRVVVNNGVQAPGDPRPFNSYNPPSLNTHQLVVFRARTKGGPGGEPAHGVYTREMAFGTPIATIFDRDTLVTYPNNLGTTIVEPPSFPRIDMWKDTVASRANHPPVWTYLLPDGTETRAGTTGIYTDPFSALITGASKLGAVPGFAFFAVPGVSPAMMFDVFPGAPAVTDGATLVFKGNYSVPDPDDPSVMIGRTGVYYRELTNAPAGGSSPVILIADSDTMIPGTSTFFGSAAPPSAARRLAVFTGWDNEWRPTRGGIYLAPLTGPNPPLTPLVEIGDPVPGEPEGTVFRNLGEGLSFDGRFVAFWATWGTDTRTLILQCPDEGNRDRLEFCRSQHPDGYAARVPVHQGIFVHDIDTGRTSAVAKAPAHFTDFVYWNFSGKVPGQHGEEEGEPARWRSASFAAVSGLADGSLADPFFHTVFKARTGDASDVEPPVDGIYLREGDDQSSLAIVVRAGMDGRLFDPAAEDDRTGEPLLVTDMAVEREGFRGRWLAVSVKMGTEEAGWAGIYLGAVDGSRMPAAAPDAYGTRFNTPVSVQAPGVLANDDPGGFDVAVELAEHAANGTLSLGANGGFVYTPDASFAGTDRFTYRVRNSRGASAPATVTIHVEAPSEPQPPTDLHVQEIRGHRVTLRWTPPRLGPGPTGYTIEGGAAPGEVGAAILVGDVALFSIDAPAGRFHVRVRTRSGAHWSAASNEIQVLVDVPASPSAPDRFLALVNGDSLALSWRSTYVPSASKGGGGEPTGFVLDVAGAVITSIPLGMAETASFSGIPPGTYRLSLRAVNAAGSSVASPAVDVTLPGLCSGAPHAPANAVVFTVENTIHVAWDPPATGPAATAYVVNVSGSFVGSFATTAREVSRTAGAGSYTLSLVAANPCGTSGATAPQTVTIP